MKRFVFILCAIFMSAFAFAQTIRWHVGDSIIRTDTCSSGDSVTPPTAPAKTGYNFVEWMPYIPIEYLGFSGVQNLSMVLPYISENYIHAKFKGSISTPSRMDIIGHDGTTFGADNTPFIWTRPNSFYFYSNVSFLTEKIYDIEYTVQPTKSVLIVDGVRSESNMQATMSNAKILNIGKNQSKPFNGKIYYYKLFNKNDGLILDLIPVLDKNNVPCMYDKVTKQIFYNQGTGQFIAGPVVQ